MIYYFDSFGWYTDQVTGKSTDVEPSNKSLTVTTGEPRSNYVGLPGETWRVIPYVEPTVIPTPVVVPTVVTMKQARLALLEFGMYNSVEIALNAIPDETERTKALIEWEYAGFVDRNSALVTSMAAALSLTPMQLDTLFVTAASYP